MDERRLNGLLNEEFKAWDTRLSRLVSRLEALKPFLQRPGKLLALDTSALMEGPPFRDFPWTTLTPSVPAGVAGPHVRLIVPILVVEELDDLMHNRDGDWRKRARDTFKALWEVHQDAPAEPRALPGQPDVTIEGNARPLALPAPEQTTPRSSTRPSSFTS